MVLLIDTLGRLSRLVASATALPGQIRGALVADLQSLLAKADAAMDAPSNERLRIAEEALDRLLDHLVRLASVPDTGLRAAYDGACDRIRARIEQIRRHSGETLRLARV
jgi:hypothetical protein